MITKSDSHKMLEHRFGGNGWAVVQWLTDNMVRLASVYEARQDGEKRRDASIGGQFMLAWVNMLKPERKQVLRDPNDPKSGYVDGGEVIMSDELQQKLEVIRGELANGTKTVVNTRLEPALTTPKQNAKIKRSARESVAP